MVEQLERNKRNVTSFFDVIFNQTIPPKRSRDNVGQVYIQHNPAVADGKESFIEYFEMMAWAEGTFIEQLKSLTVPLLIITGDLNVHMYPLAITLQKICTMDIIKKSQIQSKRCIPRIIRVFPSCFDFHGTDNTEAQLFFGTDARTNPHKSTICGLLERNAKALWDDTGLLRLLQDKGYSTMPRNIDDSEHQSFDGGLTVTKYGGCDVNQRVEAIQCEIAADLRERSNRLKFTVDMAECILKFVRPYISQIWSLVPFAR
jgi:predicted SnoaL-like aldol condensation-catalyzing enzyme